MFKKYKFLVEYGISEMICSEIGEYILVYGGNNFLDIAPPEGNKKIYNKMYLYDKDINLIFEKEGKIFPNAGIVISDQDKIYYILDNKVYLIELDGLDIKEKEYTQLDFFLDNGFGCKFENSIIFGKENLYKLSLETKKITKLSKFPARPRNQSVYVRHNNYLYVFGGASNICHLDSYRYNLREDTWEGLSDIPVSFTGSSYCFYDENSLLILGGFNKEVYDEAVKKLSNSEYKKKYFLKKRKEFAWNDKKFIYDFLKTQFHIIGIDKESATCGSGLIKVNNNIYLIGGELKPAFRNPYIFKDEI